MTGGFLTIGIIQLFMNPLLGIVLTLAGGLGLSAVWQSAQWRGSEFDVRQRLALLKDTRNQTPMRIIFDRIQQVQVCSGGHDQFSLSIVEVFTEQGKYTIVEGWEMWKAEDLAQRIGSIVQCPVLNINGERLPEIPRATLKPPPKRPQPPLAARLFTGIFFSGLALQVITVGVILYWSAQPLTQPLALSGHSVIAINQQGELHLYSDLLDRIQVFNPDGKFQRSISTAGSEGKHGSTLCGGGEYPIRFINRSSRASYDVKATTLTSRKTRDTLQFCQKSRNRKLVAWRDKLYIIKNWPQRVIVRQQGQADRVIITGSWWKTIVGNSFMIFGLWNAITIVILLVGLFFRIRREAVN